MPSLPTSVLRNRLEAALPVGSNVVAGADDLHPVAVEVPGLGRWLLYLWTVTPDRSVTGRPGGEYKLQPTFSEAGKIAHRLPSRRRGDRARYTLQFSPGTSTALLGYSPEFGVFIGWEARLYTDFAFSANIQVREELLDEARTFGWAVAEPRERKQGEVRVAFGPAHLARFLTASAAADTARRTGWVRYLDMLGVTPAAGSLVAAVAPMRAQLGPAAVATAIEGERARVAATRLARDSRFGPNVKAAYDNRCAVCGLQLGIIEGAHIIPVNDPGSTDDIWNGIALCPNHHTLFDARAFVIRADLTIAVDASVVTFLREEGRDYGLEWLTDFDGRALERPTFWARGPERASMQQALAYREALAGF